MDGKASTAYPSRRKSFSLPGVLPESGAAGNEEEYSWRGRETIPNLLLLSRKIHQENGKTKRLPEHPGALYNKIWIIHEGFMRFWKIIHKNLVS